MSNLYIDRKGVEIRSDGEALAFYAEGDRLGTVPIAPLTRVIIRGDVRLRANLLGKLGQHNVGIIILSGRKAEVSLLMSRPHNDTRLRMLQFACAQDDATCLGIAQWIVRSKLQAQHKLIQHYAKTRPGQRHPLIKRLHEFDNLLEHTLPAASSIGTLRGVEGVAAQALFQSLQHVFPNSVEFKGRNRRPPTDPANAILSLGYTLLHAETVLTLHTNGFDPYIGFYHQQQHGRESLACDIIEPLRPIITAFSVKLFSKQILRSDNFSHCDGACLLNKAGRERFYQEYDQIHEGLHRRIAQKVTELKEKLHQHHKEPENNAKEEAHYGKLSDMLRHNK